MNEKVLEHCSNFILNLKVFKTARCTSFTPIIFRKNSRCIPNRGTRVRVLSIETDLL